MSAHRTQVLFVPYRSAKDSKRTDGQISQQKHAAREYHRKAKLRRQAQRSKDRSPDNIRSKSDASETSSIPSTTESTRTSSSRSVSPTSITSITSIATASRKPSPVSVLGAGRIDPFDSQPVKDLTPCVHEMVDYALVYQWPIYKFVNPQSNYQDMKLRIAHRLRASQTSFYCVIFAAATHFALSRVGQEAPNTNLMLRLDYKDRALKLLLGDLAALGKEMPDEILHAIFSLASYSTAERVIPMASRDMKNPLATTFDLDVYSRIPAEYAHIRALSHLVKDRGGLGAVPRPGFAAVMSLYDVFTSFRQLKAPDFPLLQPTSHFVDEFQVQDSRASRMCRPLQVLLPDLPESAQFVQLKSILRNVVIITLAYEKYEAFEPSAPALNSVLMARHCVLHDLLTIGDSITHTANKAGTSWLPNQTTLYDLAWLSALSYMVLDLHPCARGPGPHELLAERLDCVLTRAQQQNLHFHQPVLYQWGSDLESRLAAPTA